MDKNNTEINKQAGADVAFIDSNATKLIKVLNSIRKKIEQKRFNY